MLRLTRSTTVLTEHAVCSQHENLRPQPSKDKQSQELSSSTKSHIGSITFSLLLGVVPNQGWRNQNIHGFPSFVRSLHRGLDHTGTKARHNYLRCWAQATSLRQTLPKPGGLSEELPNTLLAPSTLLLLKLCSQKRLQIVLTTERIDSFPRPSSNFLILCY